MDLQQAAQNFLNIDDKIHSRPGGVPARIIIADAEEYTWARRELILALRASEQARSSGAAIKRSSDEDGYKELFRILADGTEKDPPPA